MEWPEEIKRKIREVIAGPTEFAFSVVVDGVYYDAYYFEYNGKPGTFAFCKKDDQWVLAMFTAGYLEMDQVIRQVYEWREE